MSETITEPVVTQVVQDERKGGTSASNGEADLRCPGRHLAQKAIPVEESKPDPDRDSGALIHASLAEPSSAGGVILAKLSLPQRETHDRCREIERKAIQQIFPDASPAKPLTLIREKRYWVMVDGAFFHSGKPDLLVIQGKRGLLVEYKTLAGDVPEAPTNQQLRDQTVLVAGAHQLEEVFVLVDQPMVTMTPEIARYGLDEIKRSEAEMFDRVRRSNNPRSPRLAGEIQCAHCRAKQHCAEYNTFAGAMVPGMMKILDVPVIAWTPEQRGYFCERLPVAQKWLDDTKDAMKAGLEKDPGFVKGFHLAPGAERRSVKDPQALFNRFAALGGTPQKFMRCVSVTLTKLKEEINDLTGARGKALEAAIETLTEGLVEVKTTAPSLKKNTE